MAMKNQSAARNAVDVREEATAASWSGAQTPSAPTMAQRATVTWNKPSFEIETTGLLKLRCKASGLLVDGAHGKETASLSAFVRLVRLA